MYDPVSGRGYACSMAYAIAEQFVKRTCDVETIATQLGDPTAVASSKTAMYNPDAISGSRRRWHACVKSQALQSRHKLYPVYHAACGN